MDSQKRNSALMYLLGMGAGIAVTSGVFLFNQSAHRLATYLFILGLVIHMVVVFLRAVPRNSGA